MIRTDKRAESLAENGNALYSANRLKLGTFATNVDGGTIKSSVKGRAEATWASTSAIACITDNMMFEALVPLGRWRGFGGTTDHGGSSFESYTWAAAIGAITEHSAVFSTSHVPTIHPILAAKQGATIDHVTGGRFALNVVCGWDSQMEMFGTSLLDHSKRYHQAAEWLEIIQRLWSEPGTLDFDGQYYTVAGGFLDPKPITKPFPPIMNAGTSETGRRFAARYCDMAFLAPKPLDQLKAEISNYRKLAWEEFGRTLQIWTWAYVVHGETHKEAEAFYHHYVHEVGDWEGAKGQINARGIFSPPTPEEDFRRIQEQLVAGGGVPLIGSADEIADALAGLSDIGLDGVLLSWPRYQEGAEHFKNEIYPRIVQLDLRTG